MMMNKNVQDWKNKGQYFTYNDHKTFYFQEGTGENLLILHGYPYSSYEWKDIVAVLSKQYTITILDLLGMGFSDKPKKHPYSYQEYCVIINQLLKQLGVEKTHILAHDTGGTVVQELLARDLEQGNTFTIESVAWLNCGLFMDVYKPRLIQKLLSQSPTFIGKFLSKVISKKSVNASVKEVFGPNTQPSDAFLDEQWTILNYNEGKSITYLIGRLVFDKYNYQTRWIDAMQKTTIPICYICGTYDPNSGLHMAKRYEALIPNPKVYLLKNQIGHWPQIEDHEGTLQAFHDFINALKSF